MPTLYFCNKCHYTFPSPSLPDTCPDCGNDSVREATEDEKTEYERIQDELEEEQTIPLFWALAKTNPAEKKGSADMPNTYKSTDKLLEDYNSLSGAKE